MIQKNLKSFVLTNRRLIIPNIGAFLLKETADKQKQVIFSSFLKYDDGLLRKLLCEQENISEDKAKNAVEEFSQTILDTLNDEKPFFINQLGCLTKDNQGIINFVADETEKKVEIDTNPVVTTVTETENFIKTVENLYNTDEPKDETIPVYVPPIIETNNNDFNTDFNNIPKTDFEQKNDYTYNNIIIPPMKTEKNQKIGYWILIAILSLLLIILLLYIFNNNFKKTVDSIFGKDKIETVKTPEENTTTTTAVIDSTQTTQDANTTTQDPAQTTSTQTTTQTTSSVPSSSIGTAKGKYQVIVGCFLEKENAEKLERELRAQGVDVRVPNRLMGEWTIVIVLETNDLEEATRSKEKWIAAGYDDAWVRTPYYYR